MIQIRQGRYTGEPLPRGMSLVYVRIPFDTYMGWGIVTCPKLLPLDSPIPGGQSCDHTAHADLCRQQLDPYCWPRAFAFSYICTTCVVDFSVKCSHVKGVPLSTNQTNQGVDPFSRYSTMVGLFTTLCYCRLYVTCIVSSLIRVIV